MEILETAPTRQKRVIESSCLFLNKDHENPFSELKISNANFLEESQERGVCSKCNKSRRYYCYNCYTAVEGISEKLPCITLPVAIDVIKHPKEVDGKSTSAHAAVLAPKDVHVYTYPDFPDYESEDVILIFPGKSAIPFTEWWGSKNVFNECNSPSAKELNVSPCCCDRNDSNGSSPIDSCDVDTIHLLHHQANHNFLPFKKVVFIDSTWKQTKRLYSDPRIKKLPCVLLTSHKSLFWRHQRNKPEMYLSTIEAIYYFLVELHSLMYPSVPYCGRYDNLLFFFKFMYYKIRTLYDPTKLKAYQ